jgi:two-component system sensor histidine kinase/response regulator
MAESEVIDPQALERLKEWGGEKLAAQMVRLFLKNSLTRMDQIRSGIDGGDVDEAERGAHSLKSSAANIGAERLRTLATQVEAAALDQHLDRMTELLPRIEDAYATVMETLEAMEREMPHES